MLSTILIVILILLLIGALPASWPHSSSWGPGPSGLIGVLLIVLVVLLLMGRI